MKLCTLKKETKLFHGNCKSSRIRNAARLLEGNIYQKIILSSGRLHPDSRHVRRYSKAITASAGRVKVL